MRAALSALVLLAATPAAAQAPAAGDVEILGAEFGIVTIQPSGAPSFAPSRTVSLAARQDYGWLMLVRTDRPTVRWREEFTLPASAPNWGLSGVEGTTVSAEGRTAVTEQEVVPQGGAIYHFWSVADGDPKGRYVMRVTVEGQPERRFEFDVQ